MATSIFVFEWVRWPHGSARIGKPQAGLG